MINRKLLLISMIGLMACYSVTYYAVVVPEPLDFVFGVGPWPKEARFRCGGGASAAVFTPAIALEKKFYPSRWSLTYEEIDRMHPRSKPNQTP